MFSQKKDFLARLSECAKTFLPLGSTSIAISNFQSIPQRGKSSTIYSFVLTYDTRGIRRNKALILRVYRKGFETIGLKEFQILETLKANNLLVPTVYFLEPSDPILRRAFIIMEKLDGRPATDFLNSEKSARITIDKMAEVLSEIHKMDPKRYPKFRALKKQYKLEQQELLKRLIWIKKIPETILGFLPSYQRRFTIAVKRFEEPEPKKFQQAILHNDYEPNHVLISNGKYNIIDWHMASVGDAAFDVGVTYHELKLLSKITKFDMGEYFVYCYKKHSGLELQNLQFCKDVSALRLASWFMLFPFKPSNTSMFKGLVKSLFGVGILSYHIHKQRFQVSINQHHSGRGKSVEFWQNYIIQYFEERVHV